MSKKGLSFDNKKLSEVKEEQMESSSDQENRVRIGIIGHVDYDKETLLNVFHQKAEEFLDYQRKREPFVRDKNCENISTVGKSVNKEIRQTTKSALQNLTLTREYLESLKQAGIVHIRRDYLSITGDSCDEMPKKYHK